MGSLWKKYKKLVKNKKIKKIKELTKDSIKILSDVNKKADKFMPKPISPLDMVEEEKTKPS